MKRYKCRTGSLIYYISSQPTLYIQHSAVTIRLPETRLVGGNISDVIKATRTVLIQSNSPPSALRQMQILTHRHLGKKVTDMFE